MFVCNRAIKISGRIIRIAKLDADMYQFLEDPAPVIEALRASKQRVDIFHFMPGLSQSPTRYPYSMEWDNLAVLPVSTYNEWWNKQIGFKARNKARQAEKKGVSVREVAFGEDLVRGICSIYSETPIRQGRPYPHFGKDFETVYKEEATYLQSSIFIGAFIGEELIGFIKLVADEARTQAGLMNIVSMISHRDKAPTNALLAQAVRSCADRQIHHLVYSHYAYGSRDRDNLTDFKDRNGFKRVDIPRYYVPLSAAGWAAYRLGLHHRFVDRLPDQLTEKLRTLRSNWYARKDHPAQLGA
jgi:hypothetical protein